MVFTTAFQCFSQSVNYVEGNVEIPLFKQDSIASFNNALVKKGLVGNIKNSKYPLEIRVYTIGPDSRHVWFSSLMSNEKETVLTHREIYLDDLKIVPAHQREEQLSNNDKPEKIKNISVELAHKMIDSLIGNHLFSMQSYKINEYVKSERPGVMDGASLSTFEIKVGKVFRNFEYLDDLAKKDTVVNRSACVFNILKVLGHLDVQNFR